ncbi:16S rRNA (adenine(1518)-N(6)/adenine(1519)-N(6))-dimethyltransferase RsmA [Candidatus Bipolaricaulota bacterium]
MAVEELTDRGTVRRLLDEAGVRPSKRLGQNFLVEPTVLGSIEDAVAEASPRRIIEIGAGLGTVTRVLASLAPDVEAIEIDRRLVGVLERTVGGLDSVTVCQRDVLDHTFGDREHRAGTVVFGSIPYASTAPILQRLVAHHESISAAVLLTQREVAEKIETSPGASGSALGVLVKAYADVRLIRRVRRGCFFPIPDVDSTLWTMRFLETPRFTSDPASFFSVVRAIYGVRRKMLRVALRQIASRECIDEALRTAEIDETVRGETLDFEELDRLACGLEREGTSFGTADPSGGAGGEAPSPSRP